VEHTFLKKSRSHPFTKCLTLNGVKPVYPHQLTVNLNNSDILLWHWTKRGSYTCAGPPKETSHAHTHASVPHIKHYSVYSTYISNPVVHVPWIIKWNISVTTHITSCAARTPVKIPTSSSLPTCKYQATVHFTSVLSHTNPTPFYILYIFPFSHIRIHTTSNST